MNFPVIGKSLISKSLTSLILALISFACSQPEQPKVMDDAMRVASSQPDPASIACAKCHQAIFDEWVGSQHANANRLVSDAFDREAFVPSTRLEHGAFVTSMQRDGKGRFTFTTSFSNQPPEMFHAEAVIGITPLRQYLVPFPGGRWQTMDISYDPRSNEWFNAFGAENRQPHEWGHWRGRSMTWNVQCAFCHMTGFEKKYDIKEDRYASTWKAMGISCSQCHTLKEMSIDHGSGATNECPAVITPDPASRIAPIDNCASCHARREELFGTFKPGDSFHDHFRLILPDQPGVFHADGQVLDEDFEYASLMMSRMGHKGVTCLDCHNPHSGQLKLPVENNALCMQCHIPPGLNGATPIDPVGHSFHKLGTPGGRCVDCHMPENVYMMRDLRRDHGFTSPDPRLTIEHGIPNACNRCHTDQTAEWSEQWTTKWYGDKMNRRARERARAVARYYAGDATVNTQLLAMAASEEIAAWRAALIGMLQPWSEQTHMRDFLRGELEHSSPVVRSAAIRSLRDVPATMATDTSALVRVDAAAVLLERNPRSRSPALPELIAYLNNISDQPAGALRQAQLAEMENRRDDAEAWAKKARDWDPSAVPHYELSRIQHRSGKWEEAISNMLVAANMDQQNADYSYALALLIAEVGNQATALAWLQETVRRDPQHGRAWYNLGLAYAQADRIPEADKALRMAEHLMPGSAEPAYARATIHFNAGKLDQAEIALTAALKQDPQHAPSRTLLKRLPNKK